MSILRYERYKASGVAWLGEVPTQWDTTRLRVLVEIEKRIAGELGYDVLSITQQGIRIKDTESNEGQLALDYSKYQLVEPGDFAMNHMDLLTGFVDIASMGGVTSPDYRVFSVRSGVACSKRYLLYVFQNAYRQRIFYAFGQGSSHLGRWRLPTEEFNNFVVPFPAKDEQEQIVAFLDRETAKIDALIEEQQRLTTLLKEKRQAVISHAVTKGLNRSAQMKDSGVHWIGAIPSSWSLSRVKHVVEQVVDCLHSTPTYDGELLYPAIRTADLEPGILLLDQARLVSEEVYRERTARLEPKEGDVLYSREGSFGIAALVPPNTKLCLGQRMMMFRCKPEQDAEYFMWLLNSSAVYKQVLAGVSGPTAPHVNIGEVVNFEIPVPSLNEQKEIAVYLRQEASAFDALYGRAVQAIELLQERRSALISAAVTGKIDVRGLAAHTSDVSEAAYEPA